MIPDLEQLPPGFAFRQGNRARVIPAEWGDQAFFHQAAGFIKTHILGQAVRPPAGGEGKEHTAGAKVMEVEE